MKKKKELEYSRALVPKKEGLYKKIAIYICIVVLLFYSVSCFLR